MLARQPSTDKTSHFGEILTHGWIHRGRQDYIGWGIYAIVRERDDVLLYIGASIDPIARFASHLAPDGIGCGTSATLKKRLNVSDCILLILLEELPATATLKKVKSREAYWIRHFQNDGLGGGLCNAPRSTEMRLAAR